jgi:fumarylacetoacetate (FAA) hydrolase
MGTSAAKADRYIKLLVLVNDVSLRYIAQEELKKGFGFVQAKPSSGTLARRRHAPDELGDAWKETQVHLPLHVTWNHKKFGEPNAGEGGLFSFAQLIAHAARTRPLCAGTIIGSGTVSNKDPSRGHACIAEKRMIEKLETGESKTDFMKFGDTVRIEMLDAEGKTIFGAIEQEVIRVKRQLIPDAVYSGVKSPLCRRLFPFRSPPRASGCRRRSPERTTPA